MDAMVKSALFFAGSPAHLAYLNKIRKNAYVRLASLEAFVAPVTEPVEYKDRLSLNYFPVKKGFEWARNMYDCAWFRFKGETGAENPDDLALLIDIGGEGCVYDDSGVVQGLTNVLSVADFFQTVRGKKLVDLSRLKTEGGKLDIWVDAGYNGTLGRDMLGGKFKRADIVRLRKNVVAYFYDYCALWQYARLTPDLAEKKEIGQLLTAARKAAAKFTDGQVASARGILSPYYQGGNQSDFEITAVGHAHLDLAWLWPMRETMRKAERTYSNALVSLDKFPEYVFGSSQPQQFEWIKDRRPELYSRIKTAVADKRIEPQGVMWCEPDTNLPSGESLIRQCYFGKKFFRDEFNVDMDYLWVPDVFGYTAALPRILRGAGVDKFMTIKLSWNNVNKFPYHSFRWKGIGEGEVLVHMPPEGDYNSSGAPYNTMLIEKSYRESKVSKVALMPFGAGDGGGGPGEFHLNMVDRQNKMSVRHLPKVRFGSAADFFKKLEKEADKLPFWEGELYLEKHQGTYTTQGRMKRDMRKIEVMLHNTEFLCAQAALNGYTYPKTRLDEIWKKVLLHQFHDILPGSSIARVYREARQTFENIAEMLAEIQADAGKYVKGGKAYINTTAFSREGFVKDADGVWQRYYARPYAAAEIEKAGGIKGLYVTDNLLENEKIRVEFNLNGEIISLIDKVSGEESVATAFNRMRVYTDKNMVPYGAWDIDIDYPRKPSRLMKLTETKSYIDGCRCVREQTFKYNKSTLQQTIVLYAGNPCVYVENQADWQETCKMLRADFYPKHFGEEAVCDIQMGFIRRTTKDATSVEHAQFEVCAHKWLETSDALCGVAVLNDCKYGYRAKDGLISLNLLRSPVYPDKGADRGEHNFTYAIYAHKDGFLQSELIKYGYDLNYPLVLSKGTQSSFVSTDNALAVIETVCVTDDGKIAVRLYNAADTNQTAKLSAGFEFVKAEQTNLIFEEGKAVDLQKLVFTPFEIKTVLFTPKTDIKVD